MSDAVTIQAWPETVDGLAWSQEGALAIAAGENVEILLPNVKSRAEGKEQLAFDTSSLWLKVWIRTNAFYEHELLPRNAPSSFAAFSLGEEPSLSLATRLDWSSPGLARHHRCALAVLTSNLILSLWAPGPQPSTDSGWSRPLVVNHALVAYFEAVQSNDDSTPRLDQDELKRKHRVRAFAWNRPRIDTQSDREMQVSRPFLAVSNDIGDVVLFQIQSPFVSLSSAESRWSAIAVCHFTGAAVKPSLGETLATYEDYMQASDFVQGLAWSPWLMSQGGAWSSSVIACTNRHGLVLKKVIYREKSADQEYELELGAEKQLQFAFQPDAPLKWVPKVDHNRCVTLIGFTERNLVSFTVLLDDGGDIGGLENVAVSSMGLDGRWDPISGTAMTALSHGYEAHFSSILSSPQATTTHVALPITDHATSDEAEQPDWQAELNARMSLYSAQHDLAGHVSARVWSIASSPLGDQVVACVSFHPTDMVEYVIPIKQVSTLFFTPATKIKNPYIPAGGGLSHVADISTEYILFLVRKWLQGVDPEDYKENSVDDYILTEIDTALQVRLPPSRAGRDDPAHDTRNGTSDEYATDLDTAHPQTFLAQIQHRLYRQDDSMRNRHRYLVSLLTGNKEIRAEAILHIRKKIAAEASNVPRDVWQNSLFGSKIERTYAAVDQMLRNGGSDENSAEHAETCEICETPIRFAHMDWGECDEGHQFARCSLTFLAIQAPGISKFCGICGKPYLKDDFVAKEDRRHSSQDDQMDTNIESAGINPRPSVPTLLYAACNACVYCGGKFVG